MHIIIALVYEMKALHQITLYILQVYNTMADNVEDSCSSKELLTLLREGHAVVVNPTNTILEKYSIMFTIRKKQSKFPAKLQALIAETSQTWPAEFLDEIYKASKALLFGRPYHQDDDDDENSRQLHPSEEVESPEAKPAFDWWHGLNSDVDTEDQVEVVLRLFPALLSDKLKVSPLSSLNNCYPIYAQLVCSKAIPFIPLLAELGSDLGAFPNDERFGLTCFMKNVLVHLVYNNLLRDKRNERPPFEHLDAMNRRILQRLKDHRLMQLTDIYDLDLVPLLLRRSMLIPMIQTKERLRFLLEWNPYLLKDCGHGKPLLQQHLPRLQDFIVNETSCHRKVCARDFERFQLLLDLGMAHFPQSLGFVFSNTSLELACELFGTQKVTTAIDEVIRKTLAQRNNSNETNHLANNNNNNNRLQTLLLAAAADPNISLDGVYTLFRSDPIALMAKTSHGK